MVELFKVLLAIRAHQSREPVTFKPDGHRFEQEHTIKLNATTEYTLTLTVKPGKQIRKLSINGEFHKLDVVGTKDQDEDATQIYTTRLTTDGFEHTKSGKRKCLPILIEFADSAYIRVVLQCKIYKHGEKEHVAWGHKLTTLELDCSLESGQNYVHVIKEKFL